MALKGKERTKVSECSLGDWITLKYQALENKIGSFLDPGDSDEELFVKRISSSDIRKNGVVYSYTTSNNIVYSSSLEPNGTFRAVCVNEIGRGGNKKLFLCDRIIQRDINYNTVQEAGLVNNTFKIETSKFIGTAQIMNYEEIQKYLLILKEISTDYRYDLGIPALSHTLGGGYKDDLISFNSDDKFDCAWDCLEMTRDIDKDNNVRYIADYEIRYSDTVLYVGSEFGTVYISIPSYLGKTFTHQTYHHRLDGTVISSAIRPLLQLSDNICCNGYLDKNNYLYGCKKNI